MVARHVLDVTIALWHFTSTKRPFFTVSVSPKWHTSGKVPKCKSIQVLFNVWFSAAESIVSHRIAINWAVQVGRCFFFPSLFLFSITQKKKILKNFCRSRGRPLLATSFSRAYAVRPSTHATQPTTRYITFYLLVTKTKRTSQNAMWISTARQWNANVPEWIIIYLSIQYSIANQPTFYVLQWTLALVLILPRSQSLTIRLQPQSTLRISQGQLIPSENFKW